MSLAVWALRGSSERRGRGWARLVAAPSQHPLCRSSRRRLEWVVSCQQRSVVSWPLAALQHLPVVSSPGGKLTLPCPQAPMHPAWEGNPQPPGTFFRRQRLQKSPGESEGFWTEVKLGAFWLFPFPAGTTGPRLWERGCSFPAGGAMALDGGKGWDPPGWAEGSRGRRVGQKLRPA